MRQFHIEKNIELYAIEKYGLQNAEKFGRIAFRLREDTWDVRRFIDTIPLKKGRSPLYDGQLP